MQNIVVDINKLIDFIDDAAENKVKIIAIVPLHKEDWDAPESPEYLIVFTA
jgi:spore germination protein YaaH